MSDEGQSTAGEVFEIFGFGVQIGMGMFGVIGAYAEQAFTSITDLINAFLNATPQPVPGIPLCISAPLVYQICALYYILDYTLFAPATPGQYIIPLVLVLMNVLIIVYFVKRVFKIVRRGEDVTTGSY